MNNPKQKNSSKSKCLKSWQGELTGLQFFHLLSNHNNGLSYLSLTGSFSRPGDKENFTHVQLVFVSNRRHSAIVDLFFPQGLIPAKQYRRGLFESANGRKSEEYRKDRLRIRIKEAQEAEKERIRIKKAQEAEKENEENENAIQQEEQKGEDRPEDAQCVECGCGCDCACDSDSVSVSVSGEMILEDVPEIHEGQQSEFEIQSVGMEIEPMSSNTSKSLQNRPPWISYW